MAGTFVCQTIVFGHVHIPPMRDLQFPFQEFHHCNGPRVFEVNFQRRPLESSDSLIRTEFDLLVRARGRLALCEGKHVVMRKIESSGLHSDRVWGQQVVAVIEAKELRFPLRDFGRVRVRDVGDHVITVQVRDLPLGKLLAKLHRVVGDVRGTFRSWSGLDEEDGVDAVLEFAFGLRHTDQRQLAALRSGQSQDEFILWFAALVFYLRETTIV